MAAFFNTFEFLLVLLRALSYAGLTLCVGGIIFLVTVVPERQSPEAGIVHRWSRRAAVLLAASEFIRLSLTAIILVQSESLPLSVAIGAGCFAWGSVTIAAALFTAVLLRPSSAFLPLLAGGAAIVAAASMTSHAAARIEERALPLILTFLHCSGVAAWLGGLMCLLLTVRGTHPARAQEIVRRFSMLAVAAVILLATSGIGLAAIYVDGPGALYGTAYGYMLCTKVALFAGALALGACNRRLVARLTSATSGLLRRLRCFSEAEVGIGIAILLAAASLTSQPPAADIRGGRLTATEIKARFRPELPRLTSPPVKALSQLGAAIDVDEKNADSAWSEYNHHWAGMVLLAAGMLSFLDRTGRIRWASHWPLVFLGLAYFILVRADPENWPLGPRGFWSSFQVAEVLQHRIFVLLIIALAIFEWSVRTGRLTGMLPSAVFPVLCGAGGALLLTHTHSLANVKEELLAEMSHTGIAVAAIAAGCGRWLELRLVRAPIFSFIWPLGLFSIGMILVLYREA